MRIRFSVHTQLARSYDSARSFSLVRPLSFRAAAAAAGRRAILSLILGSYFVTAALFWFDWQRLKMRASYEQQSIFASPKFQASIDWLETCSRRHHALSVGGADTSAAAAAAAQLPDDAPPGAAQEEEAQWMAAAVHKAKRIETGIIASRGYLCSGIYWFRSMAVVM